MIDKYQAATFNIEPGVAGKVLSFLNKVNSAEEISYAIRLAGERPIGIKTARNIFVRRMKLGEFTDLVQVATVPQVGSQKFSRIIKALALINE